MAKINNTPSHVERNCATNRVAHAADQLQHKHMLCVSPDYCVNMAQYYLGDYAAGKFDLEKASGPHALDLGDIMYAPNLLTDKHVSRGPAGALLAFHLEPDFISAPVLLASCVYATALH